MKPRGATPTTLVSLLIDHIVAKASSTIFPYCMPIRFSEALRSTTFVENRSTIFLSHLIPVISKQQGTGCLKKRYFSDFLSYFSS